MRERLEAVGGVIVQKGTDREEDAYSAFAVPKGEEESRLVRLYKGAFLSLPQGSVWGVRGHDVPRLLQRLGLRRCMWWDWRRTTV